MNVLLINTNRNRSPMPVLPLGACMVAEATWTAGHDVTFLDLMFEKRPLEVVEKALKRAQPGIVGLSVRNIDNNDMLNPVFFLEEIKELSARIRERTEAPIVLGGSAVPVMPEQLLDFIGADWAVVGEGEKVFPELLQALEGGNEPDTIPGLAWLAEDGFHCNPLAPDTLCRRCRAPDFPRWLDLRAYVRQMATAPLQTKLGCHFCCIYCTYRKVEGGSYRLHDPESTVEAVRRYTSMGFRNIEFVDNVFNSPYPHGFAVCEALARVRHGARLQTYELNPLFVDDGLIRIMERAGFVGVGITVESAAAGVLARLRKGYSVDAVHQAAEVVRRHRLPCIWIFMLGGPGETEQTVQETLNFARTAIRPSDAAFFTTGIRIYPGTELEKIARSQGILNLGLDRMLEPVFYVSPEIRPDWLMETIRSAMGANLNFINGDTFDLPYLPAINRFGSRVGIQPPLWRYTRHIRRGLRILGADA
jgi:radical SAM superfamily enzyme YgiQ (UPF0313 family)